MRKIAANYIFIPDYPLVKQGYVVIEGKEVKEIVDTGGKVREIQGLEFYGGMIVSSALLEFPCSWEPGQDLVAFLTQYYQRHASEGTGLALIRGADLKQMVFRKDTVIERLV